MSTTQATLQAIRRHAGTWWFDAAVALLVGLGFLATQAYSGFPRLADAQGDNDSLMRMVQIRDLLGGQGWFDLHQYRMGPSGGFVMHWSRLVDAPIALLILSASALGLSQAAAEALAATLWPTLLFATALFCIMRIVRVLSGKWAMLPAAVVATTALLAASAFVPGVIDHHNFQLVLTLAMLAFLVHPNGSTPLGAGAGLCAAATLAIGMETVPYIAVAGAGTALCFLLYGEAWRRRAAGFGLGFAAGSLLVFGATVPPQRWLVVHCDSFSVAQNTAALLAGLGLAVAALVPAMHRTAGRRAVSLALVGVAVAVAAVMFFPQCLGDPYAGLDPRVKQYWLSRISEAQPITNLLRESPESAAHYYATPLLALVVLAIPLRRGKLRAEWALVGAVLAAAVAISFWQVRGSLFSLSLAAIPLAAWIERWRAHAIERESKGAANVMAVAWLLSVPMVWHLPVSVASRLMENGIDGLRLEAEEDEPGCYSAPDYAALAALPAGTVFAISNIGAPILYATAHRTIAGPYHRNIAGITTAFDVFMGTAEDARERLGRLGIDYLAHCPGNPESRLLAEWAPDGFIASLMRGERPAWLEEIAAEDGAALHVFRVKP